MKGRRRQLSPFAMTGLAALLCWIVLGCVALIVWKGATTLWQLIFG